MASPIEALARVRCVQVTAIALACLTAGCAGPRSGAITTERWIVGPKGYTVDWDLPETNTYWVPRVSDNLIQAVSEQCKAAVDVFVYHHLPRPPQYSYIGFKFADAVDDAAKLCLVDSLKAVPSMTVYPKRR